MIVVTGGAGFIGSNLVAALNGSGREDVIVVDDLTDGRKFYNLADAVIADYLDRDEFRDRIAYGAGLDGIECVYHLGACSDTTEWDGRMMMARNHAYSRAVFDACQAAAVPLIYASSAAVYGVSSGFAEIPSNERPLNVYGYSKLTFDQYVRAAGTLRAPAVGLRYFNVYGPREAHKGRMASVIQHFHEQIETTRKVRLFGSYGGFRPGQHERDFIHVDDAVAVTLWFGRNNRTSGIFNCGTGVAETFNAVANAVIDWHGYGEIEYVDFPPDLEGAYQSHTCANLDRLRRAGYAETFTAVATGVRRYLDWLAR